ncbi:MAG: hypothetical protein IJ672_02350 [Methanobrevibacter sp.]|nr:hypothetical protein [Methanobrevibacter sp.]
MLVDILGKHPQIKLIDYMLSCPFEDFTKQQLAIGSEISRSTLDRFIDDFLEYELLIKKGSRYVVNFKSVYIREFNVMLNDMTKREIEKQLQLPREDFRQYSDEEIDELFSDIPDEVDVDRLEFEIESREYYSFTGDKTTNSFDILLL